MNPMIKLLVTMIPFFLVGCSSITPSENFKQFRQVNVGRSIEDKSSEIGGYPWRVARKSLLSNGNWEYEFNWYGSCKYYYEVDSKSLIVINWRSIGSEKDCIIPN